MRRMQAMSGDHGGPRSATWILRMAAANDASGDLVAAMAQQIALPGPDADGALAAARAAYEAATGSPADDALLSIYQPDAMAVAGRRGCGPAMWRSRCRASRW